MTDSIRRPRPRTSPIGACRRMFAFGRRVGHTPRGEGSRRPWQAPLLMTWFGHAADPRGAPRICAPTGERRGNGMTAQSPTLMRCERCRAVISTAEATELVRHGVPCGVCGGTLTVCNGRRRPRFGAGRDTSDVPSRSR